MRVKKRTAMTDSSRIDVNAFMERQIQAWPMARKNYEALNRCLSAKVTLDGVELTVVHNPERIRSSAADLSEKAIAERPCFLCAHHRPAEQLTIPVCGYDILVNPFPIFSPHLTIASQNHTPQAIAGRVAHMLGFASRLEGMTVFYNGPRSGASAPDHLHFQAVPSAALPLWEAIENHTPWPAASIKVFQARDAESAAQHTEGFIHAISPGKEPDMNLYARVTPDGLYQTVVLLRAAHRPSNHGSAPGQTLVSPASAEMAGVIVAPREADFRHCLSASNLKSIFNECGRHENITRFSERKLSVGIVRAKQLTLRLQGEYVLYATGEKLSDCELQLTTGKQNAIVCNGKEYIDFRLDPISNTNQFTLLNVVIGIGFHWQQHEDQSFHGSIIVTTDGDFLQAINRVGTETYLRSVVSSEMNANAPEEFLKAHAVISRSWVLAQIMPPTHLADHDMTDTPEETVRWYDRDAHTGFDICADDHCQRYQGCAKASTPQVEAALRATCGEVLAFGQVLCDARFSKCCGGVTELFSTCWQPVDLPYLQAIDDPFCGRATAPLLRRVLNGYDQTTHGYYRWTVDYSAAELADIIRQRSGLDFGQIISLTPLHRGPSGRIDRLEIKGSRLTKTIGKELEIRRTLSLSHLFSSAFNIVPSNVDSDGIPQHWHFDGLGWGHGVGLCQIGAAQMAEEGFDYRSILQFYFPGSRLITLYGHE